MFVVAAPQHDCPLEDELDGVADGHVLVHVVKDPGACQGTGHVRGSLALDGTRVCHVIGVCGHQELGGERGHAPGVLRHGDTDLICLK